MHRSRILCLDHVENGAAAVRAGREDGSRRNSLQAKELAVPGNREAVTVLDQSEESALQPTRITRTQNDKKYSTLLGCFSELRVEVGNDSPSFFAGNLQSDFHHLIDHLFPFLGSAPYGDRL